MKHTAKPYPHTYQHRRSSCEKLLAALQRELSQILQEHQAAEAREQVLLDWIRTQELVLLQLSSIPVQQADAAAKEAMGAQAEACVMLSSQAAGYGSYVGGLLASAEPGKLEQVLHMTPADWSNTFLSSWSQLVQLLELVAHEDDTSAEPMPEPITQADSQQQQDQQQQHCASHSTHELMLHCSVQYTGFSQAPAANSNPEHLPTPGPSSAVVGKALLVTAICGSNNSSSSSSNNSSEHFCQAHQPAAAPVKPGPATTATIPLGSTAAQHMQQLKAVVDDLVLRTTLALIHHPLPLCYAAGTNCTTGQPSAAPPSHWLRVAQRLELSGMQLLHFATAAKEQQRLRGRTLQEARQLADRLAGLSLLVQAAQQVEFRNNRPLQPAGQLEAAAAGEGPVQVAEQQGTAAALTPPFSEDEGTPSELPLTEQQMLDRNLRARTMYSQLFSTFIFNTLTPVQIARLWVASMPFIPIPSAVMAAAADLFQEQQQQQQPQQPPGVCAEAAEDGEQPEHQQQQQCVGGSSSTLLSAVHQQWTQRRMAYLKQQQQLWVQGLQQ